MDLSTIPVRVKAKKPKRLGRGSGSGTGKTAGRGHKGAGQRKGKRLPYIGFRGGNLPYLRVIPKRGFTSVHPQTFQVVNLGDIQKKMSQIKEIDPVALKNHNLIRDPAKPVKILAKTNEKFNCKALIKADSFSAKAKETIEAAGGKTECLKR